MKKYVIITYDIHPIGGTQMFTAGKAKYLESQGWQVFIFFSGSQYGTAEIPLLTKYIYGCGFNELWKRPYRLSEKDRESALQRMIDLMRIDPYTDNEIIIESHWDIGAYWGELLAEKVHGRHFFVACNEVYRSAGRYYFENLDFFEFKYNRHEILSRHDSSLQKLFNGHKNLQPTTSNIPANVKVTTEMEPIQDVDSQAVNSIVRGGGGKYFIHW